LLPNKGIRRTFYLTRRLLGLARRWPRVSTPKQCKAALQWSKFLSCQCQECSEMTMNWEACLRVRRAAGATRTHPNRCRTTAEILNPSSWRSSDLCSGKSSDPRPFVCLLSIPVCKSKIILIMLLKLFWARWTFTFSSFYWYGTSLTLISGGLKWQIRVVWKKVHGRCARQSM
jgi:hypothetical protein